MTNTALDSHVVETARAFAWSTLLSLTQQMLDAAHAGEWGRVRRLEADRRQRIEHFFSVAVGPDETELVRDGILAIVRSDEELLRLGLGYGHKRPANVIQFKRRPTASRS